MNLLEGNTGSTYMNLHDIGVGKDCLNSDLLDARKKLTSLLCHDHTAHVSRHT